MAKWFYFDNPETWEYIRLLYESDFDGIGIPYSRAGAEIAGLPFHTYRRIGETSRWISKNSLGVILESLGMQSEDIGEAAHSVSEKEKDRMAAAGRTSSIRRYHGENFFSDKTRAQWARARAAGENKLVPGSMPERADAEKELIAPIAPPINRTAGYKPEEPAKDKKEKSHRAKPSGTLDYGNIKAPAEEKPQPAFVFPGDMEEKIYSAVSRTLPSLGLDRGGLVEASYKFLKGEKSKIELLCNKDKALLLNVLDGKEKTYDEAMLETGFSYPELNKLIYALEAEGLIGIMRPVSSAVERRLFSKKENVGRKLKVLYGEELQKLKSVKEYAESSGGYLACAKEGTYVPSPDRSGGRLVCPRCGSGIERKSYKFIRDDLLAAEQVLEKALGRL